MAKVPFSPEVVRSFFSCSEIIDHDVLRPLSHIRGNWELTWDRETGFYEHEDGSFAEKLNILIEDIASTVPTARYHDNEDCLAVYVRDHLKWNIEKKGARWVGADYGTILEQGGFDDVDQKELTLLLPGVFTPR